MSDINHPPYAPSYRFFFILCGLTFMTANISRNGTWGSGSLLSLILMISAGLLLSGVSLQSAAFASIATLPNLNSYIKVGSFSLTLIEIFMTLFVLVFIIQDRRMAASKFSFLLGCLFLACLASLIGSELNLSSMGMMLRYGVLLSFVAILASRPRNKSLFEPVYYGLLAIPFIACFSYSGEGLLWVMVTANLLRFSRVIYSFQYPIWGALLIPFALFIKAPRIIVALISILVSALIALSFARSIIIGTAAAGMLFICFCRDNEPTARAISKVFMLIGLATAFFLAAVTFHYFDFVSVDSNSTGQSGSSASRYYKMALAVEKVKVHPLLGFGFGAAHYAQFLDPDSKMEEFGEGMNSEFGPLHVLAEIGLIGASFLFILIIVSFQHSIKCLGDKKMPMPYKLVVLIAFGGFVSSFINSNSLNLITVYIFLVTPVLLFKHQYVSVVNSDMAAV